MSNQESILQQAKSGNCKAISILLNKSLTAKGITIVKHDLKDNCLTLVLESDKSFNSATQSKIVNFIESNLVKLNISSINSVVVCGKLTTEDRPSWQQEFSLLSDFDDIAVDDNADNSTNNDDSSNSTSASEVNTEDSYTDNKLSSVRKVLDMAFLHKNLTCKVSLENRCLRVVLDNVKLADKESCINVVKRQINYLKVEDVDSVDVYGMKEGDSIPVWSESIDIIKSDIKQDLNIITSIFSKITKENILMFKQLIIKEQYKKYFLFSVSLIPLIIVFLLFKPSYKIKGTFTLIDSDIGGSKDYCYGTGGYDDIKAYMPVTVKNQKGEILATGNTEIGKQPIDSEYSSIECEFSFEIKVPKSKFYTIGIGRRGEINYSFDEIKKQNWEVNLSIGL